MYFFDKYNMLNESSQFKSMEFVYINFKNSNKHSLFWQSDISISLLVYAIGPLNIALKTELLAARKSLCARILQ